MSFPVLAIHGGAGTISRRALTLEAEREFRAALDGILAAGSRALAEGASALDAVTLAVSLFEDCPLFNAGRGAVYTSAATHELDAAIMDGATRAAGAVACVRGVRNPVRAARVIMEASRHVLMVGEGAMAFLREQGVAFEPDGYFHTEHRLAQLREAQKHDRFGMVLDHDGAAASGSACGSGSCSAPGSAGASGPPAGAPLDEKTKTGTVGAVALDREGRLAAATSTGGMTNKLPGRVGDTPIIGAGCYADDVAAVSCTGTGETFIRVTAASELAARMRYLGLGPEEAGREVIEAVGRLGGSGGLIAVDRTGRVSLPFNSEGMYRGWVCGDGPRHVAIYGDEL